VLELVTEVPLIPRLHLMIKIVYFCHTVNRFFGQRISGTDIWGQTTTIHDAGKIVNRKSHIYNAVCPAAFADDG